MCDDLIHPGSIEDPYISRRTFGAMVAATAGVAALPGVAEAASGVVEKDVQVRTPDGLCDAVLFHPAGKGSWPAVLIWTDIMGLRPAFRDMGHRMAAAGHVVLVPNPFYRSTPAAAMGGKVDFNDPEQRKVLGGYRAAMQGSAGAARDAKAYLALLDAQPQTDRHRKAGVHGYCMGGGLSFYTAAAMPDRIAAVGSFHGGNGLVTDQPDSPHLGIAASHADYLVCQARNDDAQQPDQKDKLKAAFARAGRPASVEVYPASHGWCVPGGAVYHPAQAERAWAALTGLFARRLV